jgi:hypothetical protein
LKRKALLIGCLRQAVVMLARVMRITGLAPSTSNDERSIETAELTLLPNVDASHISNWARISWIDSLRADILKGRKTDTLAPGSAMSRAEVVIRQLLQQSGLI